jgi:hypothetical protein
MEEIKNILTNINIPIIKEKKDPLVKPSVKFKDNGAIGTISDFFIKEILFDTFTDKVYTYHFFFNSSKNKVENRRLNYQSGAQNRTHEKILAMKVKDKFRLELIEDHIKEYYIYKSKYTSITDEHIKKGAIEAFEIITLLNTNNFKPSNYLLINPLLGLKISTSYLGQTHELVHSASMPDLILDDKIIDIKSHSKLFFSTQDFFQLIDYLIWFDFSMKYLKFAKPIKKIGIYYSRFNYYFVIDLKSIFSNKDLNKIYNYGKELIVNGVYRPGKYLYEEYKKAKSG